MYYQVIFAKNSDFYEAKKKLEDSVERKLKKGWILQGGISMTIDMNEAVPEIILSQAMIKY